MQQGLIKLEGTVDAVIYRNDENGYAVLRVKSVSGDVITAVGCVPNVGVGEYISAMGEWMEHATYGQQFRISVIERSLPAEESAIFDYLSSGAIKGIGRKTAEKIVSKFGKECFYIMENEPERLCEISGITSERARKITHDFQEKTGICRLMEYLSSSGVEPAIAVKLYKLYGNAAIGLVKHNPYMLTDFSFGVDFTVADIMALNLGIGAQSAERVEAACIYTLSYNAQAGHTFLPMDKFIQATATMLGLELYPVERAAENLINDGVLTLEHICGLDAVYLTHLHEAEVYISSSIIDMINRFDGYKRDDYIKLVDSISKKQNIEYAEGQKKALESVAENPVFILTGGPGTGKTTVIKGMLAIFDKLKLTCSLAAPTGRAAKRMSEACGAPAMTIHRLLEMQYSDGKEFPVFNKNHDDPLECDVLIIDEMSMVDIMLMRAVIDALPSNCRLIMVGDADQLPSVGAGNVLKDFIDSGVVPCVRLTEIFRQAAESNIVVGAHKINAGEMPDFTVQDSDLFFIRKNVYNDCVDTIVDLVSRRLPDKMGFAPEQIQVLTTNKKFEVGTAILNRRLQQQLNPPSAEKGEKNIGERIFRTGDRVMQVRNNYDRPWRSLYNGEEGLGVFNGDIGKIRDIDLREETISVEFDERMVYYPFSALNELELAYAMTVHKAQGSEFDAVVFATLSGSKNLMHRSILYTAVTRAKSLLVMVGDVECVKTMLANNKQRNRFSGLRARLCS